MRKAYTDALRKIFCEKIRLRRAALDISQEEMASRLEVATRAYINLEHGSSCCGALTLALFLIYINDDATHFLNELRTAFEVCNREAA
ncbi:MAG: helix-turn-helix transcriptional regulator [Clostridia bacterium]|nr:helix-turn-helix transcriptional regulator [Clostridia bacterium]